MTLGTILASERHYDESLAAFQNALALGHRVHAIEAGRASVLLASGQIEPARQTCESVATPMDDDDRHFCLALVYQALRRQTDAEHELKALQLLSRDRLAYAYAEIFAQWHDTPKALQWLNKAVRLHDPSVETLEIDGLLDPIRSEPQFKAIEARLNFPQ
jgi:tetratricopeptide (TPR) repeat protein